MIVANGLVCLGLFYMYRRIFVINNFSTFDIYSWMCIAICAFWIIGFFFLYLFGCAGNVEDTFNSLTGFSICRPRAILEALMVSDPVLTFFTWLSPIPMIWQLKMKMRKRIGVTAIFSLPLFSIAVAIVRVVLLFEVSNTTHTTPVEYSLVIMTLLYWSVIETALLYIAACLGVFHRFAMRSRLGPIVNSMKESMKKHSAPIQVGKSRSGS
jgi:hypothetical protein